MGARLRSKVSVPVLALFTGLAGLAALGSAAPAQAQREGQTCIGHNCGRELGFTVEHCHVRPGGDPDGDQICWSSLPADFACEQMGFEVNVVCPAAPGPTSGLGSLLLTAAGGYNVFRTEIRRTAVSRAAAAAAAPAAGEEPSEEGEGRSRLHFGEIHAALEYEDWTLAGVKGDTPGARFSWRREAESGRLLSVAASYQRAEADRGASADLASASLAAGHDLGDTWRWSVNATASHLSDVTDLNLYGGGAQLYFESNFAGGQVLSGGATYQYTASDQSGSEDFQVLGAGVAFGFPLGQRLTLDLDLFAIDVLSPDVPDDFLYTAGAELGVYLTPRLGLVGGYRVLEGISDLTSGTFTFGGSTRW